MTVKLTLTVECVADKTCQVTPEKFIPEPNKEMKMPTKKYRKLRCEKRSFQSTLGCAARSMACQQACHSNEIKAAPKVKLGYTSAVRAGEESRYGAGSELRGAVCREERQGEGAARVGRVALPRRHALENPLSGHEVDQVRGRRIAHRVSGRNGNLSAGNAGAEMDGEDSY